MDTRPPPDPPDLPVEELLETFLTTRLSARDAFHRLRVAANIPMARLGLTEDDDMVLQWLIGLIRQENHGLDEAVIARQIRNFRSAYLRVYGTRIN